MIIHHEAHRELALLAQRELDRLAGEPRLERSPAAPPRLAALRALLRSAAFRLHGIPVPSRHLGTC
jgi:hypothetical protein